MIPSPLRLRLLAAGLLLAPLGLPAAAPAGAAAPAVEFVRVWPRWQDADGFKRISEYFTGIEVDGGRVVVRTHPAVRAGYYFTARLKPHPGVDLAGAKFVLHIIVPGKPEPESFTFPADAPAGIDAFEIGLTGTDWPDKKIKPVAWRFELRSADGRPLAAQQSFLWSKPPGSHG